MRTKARIATAAILLGLGLVSHGVTATPGLAATDQGAQTAEVAIHCNSYAEPVSPGSKELKITSRSCATDPAKLPPAPSSINTWYTLVTVYEHVDYGGSSDTISGQYGSCDSSGYGISNVNQDVSGISSYRLYGTCTVSEKCTGYSFSGTCSELIWGQSQPYVGATYNDNLRSLWVLQG